MLRKYITTGPDLVADSEDVELPLADRLVTDAQSHGVVPFPADNSPILILLQLSPLLPEPSHSPGIQGVDMFSPLSLIHQ